MNTQYKILTFIYFLALPVLGLSQIKEEILNVGKKKKPEVNVKNFQKKSENPERYPSENTTQKAKDTLTYKLIDIPAISDFKTSELPPQPLNTNFKTPYYDNYAKVAYGNRNTLLMDAYITYPINKNTTGLKISGITTEGPKDNYDWKTSSSILNTEGFYIMKLPTGKLHLAGNYTYHGSNYYGINAPELFSSPNMNLKQNINQLTLKSDYDLYSNNYLDFASLRAGYWWDKFNSKESFANLKGKLAKSDESASIMIMGLNFGAEADVLFNYTDTQFGLDTKNHYSYLTFGLSPVFKISSGDSYLKLGANVMYNGEINSNNTKFFLYPKAEFLFHISKEIRLYTGVDGGLTLHNMADLSTENPYLFSNQKLAPTNNLYRIYVGTKGDIGKNIKYDGEVSFKKAENLLFYQKNPYNIDLSNSLNAYNRLNTFSTVYDDGNIINIKGNIRYLWENDTTIGINAEYNHYDLDKLKYAYNMPKYKIGIDANYNKLLDNKLSLGTTLFFNGDRKSNYFFYESSTNLVQEGIINLKSYIDINLSISYKALDKVTFFLNGNNLFGQNYQQYQGYKVLGTQILGGALIKF